MAKEIVIRPFSDLLSGTWGIFKGVWKDYLWLYLIELAATILFMAAILGSSALSFFLKNGSFNVDSLSMASLGPVFLAGLILIIPITIALQLAIYRTIYNGVEKKDEPLKESVRYGFTNIWPFFLVSIMLGLILISGYILLIIPGIILTAMFSMFYPVFVLEGVRGFAVLKRSKELTDGHKWTILGKYVLFFLVYILASIIVGIVGGIFGDSVSGLFDQILSFFLTPLAIGFTYLIYQDLKTKK